jgi:flagellar biosynthesis/type III secretory pathway M-ring protein FliF/YscJ
MAFAINDYVIYALLIFVGLIIIYFIIKELRTWRNQPRLAQIELDREKLDLIKADMGKRGEPYSKLSDEKLGELRQLDEENTALEVGIFGKQKTVESRIQRLENQVTDKKYDKMLDRIREEEIKLR